MLDSGQKVETARTVALSARLPDRLYADVSSALRHRQLCYDGKTSTIYGAKLNYYGTSAAPPTIADMLADAASKHGVEFALSDLFTFGSEKASAACGRIRSSGCALPASATCERTRSSTRRSLRIRTASSARARLRPERSRLVLIDARVLKRRRGKSAMVDFAAPDRHATAFAGL